MIFYASLALSAFMLALLGTRFLILAQKNRVRPVSIPVLLGKEPAPAFDNGGLALVFAMLIPLLAADFGYDAALGMLLLSGIYLLHSIINVPVLVRALVHIMAVAAVLSAFPPVFSDALPGWLDKLLAGIVWLWFMRLFAATDHMDGLCATHAAGITSGLCLMMLFADAFTNALSIYSLITATACTGFLWWNWPRAKIRLGGVGSWPLGFLLGYLFLLAAQNGFAVSLLILPAYLFADALITGFVHIFLKKPSAASYYNQKAIEQGRPPGYILRIVIGAYVLLAFLATRYAVYPDIISFNISAAYLSVCFLLGFLAHTPVRTHD